MGSSGGKQKWEVVDVIWVFVFFLGMVAAESIDEYVS
jgi:hypothetical protein